MEGLQNRQHTDRPEQLHTRFSASNTGLLTMGTDPNPIVHAALSFKRNPDNPYDENAIAVHNGAACTKKTHIGHLPRDVAKMVRTGGQQLPAGHRGRDWMDWAMLAGQLVPALQRRRTQREGRSHYLHVCPLESVLLSAMEAERGSLMMPLQPTARPRRRCRSWRHGWTRECLR